MNQHLFESLNLSPAVLDAVKDLNYSQMTPIQCSAIPLILEGQDIVGRSSTGTGKTAAFGLPIVERAADCAPGCPRFLVLAPTRELALQISGELRKFARYTPRARVATVYGGDSISAQAAQLRSCCIVVGTPGRVMDHMRRGTLNLKDVEMAVLDEADEMLDMGFVDDIRQILSAAPEGRQTLLFSATMPPAILTLTREFQRDPKVVAVDGGQRTLDSIEQFFYHVPQAQKMPALNLLLQRHGGDRAVVFCNTRRMVDEVVAYLSDHGFSATGLHGEMTQGVRSRVMSDFKMGRLHVLVATDVAARGIDVEDVKAVFNYDIPADDESYVHRIGRTGRAGRKGASHTLACSPAQIRRIKELERFLRAPIQRAMMPPKEEIHALRQQAARRRLLESMNTMDNLNWGPVVDQLVEEGLDLKSVACTLMQMAESSSRMDLPDVTDIVPAPSAPSRATGRRAPARDEVTLQLSIGRNQRVEPGHILSALVQGAQVPAASVGRIDLFADFSRVRVTPEAAKAILQTMQLTRIHGCRVRIALTDAAPARPRKPARPRPGKRPS